MSRFCKICKRSKKLFGCTDFQCNSKTIKFMRYKSNSEKKAQLIYEESIKGYCFRFTSGYDKTVIEILKKAIPANRRETTGPPEWKWYFGEEFFDLMKLALESARFDVTIVTKDEVEELRKKQEEASRSVYKPASFSINDEIQKFINLLIPVFKWPPGNPQDHFKVEVENWNKEAAIKAYRKAAMFYHPDRNGGNGENMSKLNATWNILKEGYYIK